MLQFSETFVFVMIILSLAGITVGTVSLLVMLVRDIKSKKLW